MNSIAQKIEIDFTDEAITSSGGSVFLSSMSEHIGIPDLLSEAIKLKCRRRGADDVQTMVSLIYCFAQGDGKLLDVDRLLADETRQELLDLKDVPGHRRLGEYLFRFDDYWVERLLGVAHGVAGRVAPEVIDHELSRHGYIPVFVDGSAIEVTGNNFECAGQIAQLLLCAVQFKLLPQKAREHGIRTVIRDLIRTAAKLVRHARRTMLRFTKNSLRLDWIAHAADQLELLIRPPPA